MERRARRPEPGRSEPGLFDDASTPPPAPRVPEPAGAPVTPPPAPAAPPATPARAEPAPPPLFTVAQLSLRIHSALQELGRVRVEGEVAQKKRTASGHVYFDLKDAAARLACKVWQSQVPRVLRYDPVDGAKVIAWGRLDLYAPQGSYSLIVDRLEPLGLGALLAQLE